MSAGKDRISSIEPAMVILGSGSFEIPFEARF